MITSCSSEGLFLLGDDLLRFVLSFLGVDMVLPFACVSKSAPRLMPIESLVEHFSRHKRMEEPYLHLETRVRCVVNHHLGGIVCLGYLLVYSYPTLILRLSQKE